MLTRLLRWLRLRVLSVGAARSSRHETWVTARGEAMHVGEMSRSHLVNALAMVVREAGRGQLWYYSIWPNEGQIRHSQDPFGAMRREDIMLEVLERQSKVQTSQCPVCKVIYFGEERECDWCPGSQPRPL